MRDFDRDGINRLLLQLEEGGYLNPQYKFYRVDNEPVLLGRGGFSCCYEMYDEKNPKRHYAAKVIGFENKAMSSELILRTTQLQYFLGEQSENIVRILALWELKISVDETGDIQNVWYPDSDAWEEEGILLQIILMEKLDSVLSKDKYKNTTLSRESLKSETEVVQFAWQIGRAILTAHNNNVLHRDIKLENIFWDENLGQYKLGDFGIAKLVEEGNAETVVFTDGYGAPEIERRLTDYYNATADIYSFGITLYLLLNDLKFPGSEGYYVNIVQYSPDFVFPAPVNASEEMARIIRKMCSYHIEDRYQSVEEVLMELETLSGSSAEDGFDEEYEDIATETYREDKAAEETAESENGAKDDLKNDLGKQSKENGEKRESTRQERKQKTRDDEAYYAGKSVRSFFISAVLFVLLFKSFSPNAEYVSAWQFWILPIVLLAESVLQRVGEFHVEFGILTIAAAVYSMDALGTDVPQVIFLLAVLAGLPSITAGCAVGGGLWTAQMMTGKWAWIDIFGKRDWGWLVLILLIAVISGNAYARFWYHKTTQRSADRWLWIFDKVWCLFIIAGILLSVLGRFGMIEIPEIVRKLHLVRVGAGIFVSGLFYVWYYQTYTEYEKEMEIKNSDKKIEMKMEMKNEHLDE